MSVLTYLFSFTEKKVCKTRCGPEASTPSGALSFPPSILLLTPEGRSFRRGTEKEHDMANQHYIYRYSIKLNEAENRSFEAFYSSYQDQDSDTYYTGNTGKNKSSKRKIPRKKSDALRQLIDVGLKHSGFQVELAHARNVNVNALLTEDIRDEIRRIGVNINQLTKVMNTIASSGGHMSESTGRKMSKSLQMAVEHMNDILKRFLDNISVIDNKGNMCNTDNKVIVSSAAHENGNRNRDY